MFKHKNLMMMKMKICCAAVLVLGLAACGSETVAPAPRVTVAPGVTPAEVAAQVEQALLVRDIDAAQKVAKAAAAEALDHFNGGGPKVEGRQSEGGRSTGRSGPCHARADGFRRGDTQATAAEMAATEAEMARADAWTAVAAADAASMSAMDATTLADAQMYQEDAEDAKATAEEQATGAGMNYMDAMDAAAAAETAADTHVLGLFMSANAYDVKDDDANEAEVASVGAAIALAADAMNGGQAGEATAAAAWDEDVAATDNAAAMPGLLKITVTGLGLTDGTFTSDTVGTVDDDGTVDVKPNAKQTNVGGDFPHMFDISSGGARVLVFTDKEQQTPGVEVVTAVTITNGCSHCGTNYVCG